jgi:hypothetical protein
MRPTAWVVLYPSISSERIGYSIVIHPPRFTLDTGQYQFGYSKQKGSLRRECKDWRQTSPEK